MNAYITTASNHNDRAGTYVSEENAHVRTPNGYVSNDQSARTEGQYVTTADTERALPVFVSGRMATAAA